MAYAIIMQDKAGSAELRAATRPAHLEYLSANTHRILAGGALINDDGTGGDGGIIIVDTDDRAEAERFSADDPYTQAGLFQSVVIKRWRKVFLDGKRLM